MNKSCCLKKHSSTPCAHACVHHGEREELNWKIHFVWSSCSTHTHTYLLRVERTLSSMNREHAAENCRVIYIKKYEKQSNSTTEGKIIKELFPRERRKLSVWEGERESENDFALVMIKVSFTCMMFIKLNYVNIVQLCRFDASTINTSNLFLSSSSSFPRKPPLSEWAWVYEESTHVCKREREKI